MPIDVDLLRSSFALVVERAPDLTARFYAVLFAQRPEVRPLFGASLHRQETMLAQALTLVVAKVEDGTWLAATLRAMGERHVGYGVRDEMYAWVGEALLTTLADVAGDAWTPPVAEAWTEAFGAIAGWMLEGARAAREPKPVPVQRTGDEPGSTPPS